ncbi:MAG TPA: site-specific integrase [Desulfovibrio sp.]|uniref:tyrosine-type recombinase/integrase n=1 Tax=Desulfovibrio sp. TaxID=885 RepID=UPI002CCCCAAA|nr:site-specific integrase [Desulfovibrio sp.]HMM37915.1 site-specific integrase [Desulfovibrio sp.]
MGTQSKRHKVPGYPGVYYREAERIGGSGTEKIFYIVFKRDGKTVEAKAGRQYADQMTPARASRIRADMIEGRRKTPQEIREEEAGRWTLDKLFAAYMEHRARRKCARMDRVRYEKHLAPRFGGMEPPDITPWHVEKLKKELAETKACKMLRQGEKPPRLSPQSIRNILELLRRITNWGAKTQRTPGLGFKLALAKVNNLRTEDLSREQLAALLRALDQESNIQVAGLVRLCLYTGLRQGELFRLRWEDLDFERGFIHLRDPKGGVDEKVPMNATARDILASHPRTGSPFVFPGRGGGQRTNASEALRRIRDRAGLPRTFRPLHGLRHAYASMLASSGQVDLYTLQKLLTHKGPQMTQRYAHLRDQALKDAAGVAVEQIEKALGDRTGKVVNLSDYAKE